MSRRRQRKNRKDFSVIVVAVIFGAIMYASGYGHGQSSAYLKMNDGVNIMSTYMEGLKDDNN